MKIEKCVSYASLGVTFWLNLKQIVFEGIKSNRLINVVKLLNLLGMVPRAGLEPARPMLSKPRILSPEWVFFNYSKGLVNLSFFKKSCVKTASLGGPLGYQLKHSSSTTKHIFHHWSGGFCG